MFQRLEDDYDYGAIEKKRSSVSWDNGISAMVCFRGIVRFGPNAYTLGKKEEERFHGISATIILSRYCSMTFDVLLSSANKLTRQGVTKKISFQSRTTIRTNHVATIE